MKRLLPLILFSAFFLAHASADLLSQCSAIFDVKYEDGKAVFVVARVLPVEGFIPLFSYGKCNGKEVYHVPLEKAIGCESFPIELDYSRDSDSDGLPDIVEYPCSLLETPDHVRLLAEWSPDTDWDGLTDKEEIEKGSLPFRRDSDGDGLNDYFEVKGVPRNTEFWIGDMYNYRSMFIQRGFRFEPMDPMKQDTDGDGLSDYEEFLIVGGFLYRHEKAFNDPQLLELLKKAPVSRDTDGDGLSDYEEFFPICEGGNYDWLARSYEVHESYYINYMVLTGAENPVVTDDYYLDWFDENCGSAVTSMFTRDTDGDGLSDYEEAQLGTSIFNKDSDADFLGDKEEVELGTDPLLRDSDGDRLFDGFEVNTNASLKLIFVPLHRKFAPFILSKATDPLKWDTDGDGLSDYEEIAGTPATVFVPNDEVDFEIDRGQDYGKAVVREYLTDSTVYIPTDPTLADTDGDGIDDSKDKFVWAFVDSDEDGLNDTFDPCPAYWDCDFDGLSDGDEKLLGTNLLKPDTDCDKLPDGFEAKVDTERTGRKWSTLNLLGIDSDGDGYDDGTEVLCFCNSPYYCYYATDAGVHPELCTVLSPKGKVYFESSPRDVDLGCKEKKEETPYESYRVKLRSLTPGVRVDAGRILGKIKAGGEVKLSYADSYYAIWLGDKKWRCSLESASTRSTGWVVDEKTKTVSKRFETNSTSIVDDLELTLSFECPDSSPSPGFRKISDSFILLLGTDLKPSVEIVNKSRDNELNVGIIRVLCRNCKKLEVSAAGAYVNGRKKKVVEFKQEQSLAFRTFRIVPIKRFYHAVEGPGAIYSKYEDYVEVLKTGKEIGTLLAKAELAKSKLSKFAYGVVAVAKGVKVVVGGIEAFVPAEEEETAEKAADMARKSKLAENIKKNLIDKGIDLLADAIVKAADKYEEKVSRQEYNFRVVVKACNDNGCVTASDFVKGYIFE